MQRDEAKTDIVSELILTGGAYGLREALTAIVSEVILTVWLPASDESASNAPQYDTTIRVQRPARRFPRLRDHAGDFGLYLSPKGAGNLRSTSESAPD
jgi:hypothetical protein